MKPGKQEVPARFAQETRFDLAPQFAQPFRGAQEEKFDDAVQTELNTPLRRAANEAAALAWTTSFPLLVFPTLLEEKARQARLQLQKQKQVRAHCNRQSYRH